MVAFRQKLMQSSCYLTVFFSAITYAGGISWNNRAAKRWCLQPHTWNSWFRSSSSGRMHDGSTLVTSQSKYNLPWVYDIHLFVWYILWLRAQDTEVVDLCLRSIKALASHHYKDRVAGKIGLGSHASSYKDPEGNIREGILSQFLRSLLKLLLFDDYRLDANRNLNPAWNLELSEGRINTYLALSQRWSRGPSSWCTPTIDTLWTEYLSGSLWCHVSLVLGFRIRFKWILLSYIKTKSSHSLVSFTCCWVHWDKYGLQSLANELIERQRIPTFRSRLTNAIQALTTSNNLSTTLDRLNHQKFRKNLHSFLIEVRGFLRTV